MTNYLSEDLIPWRHAAECIPGNPHVSTLHRWRLKGVRGHRLESILVGGSRFTSHQAIARFIAALNERSEPTTPPVFSAAQRQRMSDAARAELATTFGI